MTDNFVGFAASPRPDPKKTLIDTELVIVSTGTIAKALAPFITQSGIEGWLGPCQKFDFRTGAKIKYTSNDQKFGASYSMIVLPKRIVLVTESLGEVDVRLSEGSGEVTLTIRFRFALLPNQIKGWRMRIDELEGDLRGALGG
jgi:hypothetical protein